MTYGPGVAALAAVTGADPEEVATKPGVALRATAAFAREMARLAADRASTDPEVRAAAERRTAEVAALARAADAGAGEAAPSPAAERFRARVEESLAKVLRDLEAAGAASN